MKEFIFRPQRNENCEVKAWIHFQNDSKIIKQKEYPAVIICPGGGYVMVSDTEADPVALKFFAAGYNTFTLTYSVKEQARSFDPLSQLASVVAKIRKKAEDLQDDLKIASLMPNQDPKM